MLIGGIVAGLLVMLGLAVLLKQDREARLGSAQRQALALSTGVDRLLRQEFGSLERAMSGVAADAGTYRGAAPEQAGALLRSTIQGVVARRAELDSLVLVDRDGRVLAGEGRGDATLRQWLEGARGDGLVVGPLESRDAGWWLRVAWPFDGERWLLARLRTAALEGMIRDLDIGVEGSVAVLDRGGVVLARQPEPANGSHAGRQTRLPPSLAQSQGTAVGVRTSQIDGVERITAFSAMSGYDVVVVAGLGLREALAPWYRAAWIAAGFALLYWICLAFFIHRLVAGERVRAALLEDLEEQAEWLDQAQRASRTGVWRVEAGDGQVKVSPHTAAMFGFEPRAATLPVQPFFDRIHPAERDEVRRLFARAMSSGEPYSTEYRVLPRPDVERWIRTNGGVAEDSQGRRWVTGTVADVTGEHEAQARVERAEGHFRALFERNPLPFWVFDTETLHFLAVNDAAIASYGYSQDEFRSMTILDIRPPSDRDRVVASMDARGRDQDMDGIWTHVRRDGSRLDVRVFSSSIEFGGRPARLVLAEDVSDRVAYERQLAWRAAHDDLTGLLRLSAIVEWINDRHAPGTRYAVAFVRLRDVELVTSTLGAMTGEVLLREVAARVAAIGRKFGAAGFWPGESFVLVALDASRRQAMLDALEMAFAAPVQTEGGAHPVEACIGVAEGPTHGETPEQVVGHAALAALHAEREMVTVMPYDGTMAEQAAEHIAMARRLRNALRAEEFELHYQPIHRLSDGKVVALEALLRWRRDGAMVPPAVFIPLAETSGLIVPIGRWVLEQAVRCHARLAESGFGDVSIAVNVSAIQLLGESLAETVIELRRRYRLPAGALHVELTESVVLRQPQLARARMLELREAGVPISIDDFGTGFSSMAYLRDLPLDYLKIDRSFVQDVHADERKASICRAMISLAAGLGLDAIAEGVEQPAERDWLRAHGCGQAQGYLFGRPAPLEQTLQALAAAAPRPVQEE